MKIIGGEKHTATGAVVGTALYMPPEMIRGEMPDFAERIFYVCGPPGMVKTMTGLLQGQLQIPANRIKQENFAGY